MIHHILIWKFKDDVELSERDELLADLRTMLGEITVLRSLAVGENFSPERARGYTHVMAMTFEDRDGLREYAGHPYHVERAARLRAAAAEAIVVDLEA